MRKGFIGILTVTFIGGAGLISAQGIVDANLELGKQRYTTYCEICHGPKGDGKGVVGLTLTPSPRDFTKAEFKYGGTDQDLFEVITNGAASKGGHPLMAPWGAVIPASERWALVKYVRSFKP